MKWTYLRNDNKPKQPKRYYNQKLHPELQDIHMDAGRHSAQMKQMEELEKLLRALIDIQITSLPKDKKIKMLQKYKELI